MSAVLQPGQKLKRIVKIYGVDVPCVVTLTDQGISLKVKGSKVGVSCTWQKIALACETPTNVPSKLHGRPLEFLQDTATRLTASLIKRLDKEAKEKHSG
jgi:hypothetical protein